MTDDDILRIELRLERSQAGRVPTTLEQDMRALVTELRASRERERRLRDILERIEAGDKIVTHPRGGLVWQSMLDNPEG
ncbi:MAG: hypothetical protein LC679_07590 [Intrasporangiaceae bacterium]|nr:hypothetical protein [Intrasporangiaceae bacterium]